MIVVVEQFDNLRGVLFNAHGWYPVFGAFGEVLKECMSLKQDQSSGFPHSKGIECWTRGSWGSWCGGSGSS